MSGQLRRIERNGATFGLEKLMFWGHAPNDETQAERYELMRRYRAVLAEYKEGNAQRLWLWLRQAHDKWIEADPRPASATMTLVADVLALRDVEREIKEGCEGAPSSKSSDAVE